MKIFDYKAYTGLGVIFSSKTFVLEKENNLYVISPGPMEGDLYELLSKSKKAIHFISPNGVHHFHLAAAKKLFKDASFYGGKRAASQSGIELEKIEQLPLEEIQIFPVGGNKVLSEVCFLDEESRSLIATDLFFNMIGKKQNLATTIMFTLAGVNNRLATSRLVTASINDKAAFKSSLKLLCELDFDTAYTSHGDPITKNEFVRHFTSRFKL